MADGKVTISTLLDNGGLEKGIKGVSGILGGLTKTVAGVAASITAAFGAAAVAITKQAVDSYADYEQLIGGVETLFKDAADKVVGYAENAFYTVGISANEYMETVTSFSASLISSLAGDTAKAAKVADMALTDMADNANKMGTPLESIKTAYQGFAKQNYTMLDNLKLGYGGTKTEMERLLKDAQKLTGVKYDINNLSDVYNAIHAIQVELGIAGTTAKEAEKTIAGSANMTKAAWKNVLTAIAGGGDLDKAINNLVYSLSRYFDNMLPVVERSLEGIGVLIERIAPKLVETVAASLIRAIPSLINAVFQMIVGLADGIYLGINALLSGDMKEIGKQLNEDLESAAGNADDLTGNIEQAGKAAKKYLAGFDEITQIGVANSTSESETGSNAPGSGTTDTGTAGISKNAGTVAKILEMIEKIRKEVERLFAPAKNIDYKKGIESLKKLGNIFTDLGKSLSDDLEWGWFNIMLPLQEWTVEEFTPATIEALADAFDMLSEALDPTLAGLESFFEQCEPIFDWIGDAAVGILGDFGDQFDKIGSVFAEKGPEIERILSNLGEAVSAAWVVIEPLLDKLEEEWSSVLDALGDATAEDVRYIIDGLLALSEFLAGAFTLDWKRALNGLIDAANAMLEWLFGDINKLFKEIKFDVPDWIPGIGGQSFSLGIGEISVPQIPHLAKGAVLPANKPFLAMLGDQRHGTNIEAPLSTIQEAVAAVMADYEATNLAGHEATVEVLQQLLAAVLGIEVGDTTIGQAANRYNRRMAVTNGGV